MISLIAAFFINEIFRLNVKILPHDGSARWPASFLPGLLTSTVCLLMIGCSAADHYARTERSALEIIAAKQQQALGHSAPFSLKPGDILRRRLLIEQNLPQAGPESLGSEHLPPVPHWPQADLPEKDPRPQATDFFAGQPLSLMTALKIAAANSRTYQDRKEDLFRSALALDFERDQRSTTVTAGAENTYLRDHSDGGGTKLEGTATSLTGELSRVLASGMSLTSRIGLDLIQMLQPSRTSASGLSADASITIPLLRGAGRHIADEPLLQAEREVLYAVWEFERFKKEFALNVTRSFFSVLQAGDALTNQEDNYRSLIASSRRAGRLAEAGKLPQIQVDQARQDELRARDRWVAAGQSRIRALDEFKILLGLPTDATISLDRDELLNLEITIRQHLAGLLTQAEEETSGGAASDAPIIPQPPAPAEAGQFELQPAQACRLALDRRNDLKIARAQVVDAQRQVVVAANALLPELTFFGSAATGTSRTIAALQPDSNHRLDFNQGVFEGILTLDPAWERTAEAIAYRDSYISLERAVRAVQELEDEIKLQVRNNLRDLVQARASLKVQTLAARLAQRRVRGAELELQAGRAQMRDLLEANDALLSAQNALTSAMIDYRLAELSLQRDLGLLIIDEQGLWHESPVENES